MAKPLVAIVGRPNVGKSTFFNKVVGKKISIVENFPGVTRDRLYADAEWCGRYFTLVDTGGLELKSTDQMWKHIQKQAEIAIETADVIILFADAKTGLNASDEDVAMKLRKSGKPVVLAVNKLDNYDPEKLYEFYNLGLGEPFGISAEHGTGIGELLDEVMDKLKDNGEKEEDDSIKLAVVGKPNAGKSSLCNKLLGFDRTIVSDIAGTTRDAIDTVFTYKDKEFTLIDTAGIHSSEDYIEQIGINKSLESLKKAQLVLLVLDGSEELTSQDEELLEMTKEYKRIVVINKMDSNLKINREDAVYISSLNKDLKQLEVRIKEMFNELSYNDEPLLFNARQLGLLNKAKEHLLEAKTQAEMGQVIDLIEIDLKQAYSCILEILGKKNKEGLLDNIFSKFCLGK